MVCIIPHKLYTFIMEHPSGGCRPVRQHYARLQHASKVTDLREYSRKIRSLGIYYGGLKTLKEIYENQTEWDLRK